MEVLKTRRDMAPLSVAYLADGATVHSALLNLCSSITSDAPVFAIIPKKGTPGITTHAYVDIGAAGGLPVWAARAYSTGTHSLTGIIHIMTNASRIILPADAAYMFKNVFDNLSAGTLTVNLANIPFDFSLITDAREMFSNPYISGIFVPASTTLPSGAASTGMFSGCTSLVGGSGTAYDANHTDGEYARIDNPPTAPGYFTAAT